MNPRLFFVIVFLCIFAVEVIIALHALSEALRISVIQKINKQIPHKTITQRP